MIQRLVTYTLVLTVLAHVVGVAYLVVTGYRSVFVIREVPRHARAFLVPNGSSLMQTLNRLHKSELAPKPFYVRLALLHRKPGLVVKKGQYLLPERASTWDILNLFDQGQVQLIKLTVPEGLDKWETAALLGTTSWGSEAEFQTLIDDPAPIAAFDPQASDLEGYLFPETYLFEPGATPREIVQAMVEQFLARTRTQREALTGRNLSPRQWVTLASLVEKESAVASERFAIAGVFDKRLEKGMLLQCDPTIIYSLKRQGLYRGRILKSEITFDSPYNTYVYPGLPPGPIASPGFHSLHAALEPQGNPYYYFVSKNDGTHHFSKSLREHNRAVRKFQRGR